MAEPTTTTEQENTAHVADALGMSDADFANMDPADFELQEDFSEDASDEDAFDLETSDDSTFEEEDTDEELADEEDADAVAEASDDEGDATDTETDDDTEEDGEADEGDENSEDPDSDDEAEEDQDSEDKELDYKAEYEKLMATFKANGHEMKVRNADEARRLMQMGANYNKKMAAIKPSLKTVKLLDKHGLNDADKISHLIDLSKGDKGAIQKLLKDSEVDPMDLDSEEDSDYRPNTYNVDDREMELDEVLDTLQDTPTYSQTVDTVSRWDNASKQIIADNPRVLEVLNTQMANGIYGQVSTEVERQRALGELTGVSDIDAYKQVGDRMAAEGAFNDAEQPASTEKPTPKPAPRKTRRKAPDPKLKQKKRAVSSTKTKPASKGASDFNPLGMSDDEFEKQFDPTLL